LNIFVALALGHPATSRPKVPWKQIKKNVRNFISAECLPDDIAESIDEPSGMSVAKKEQLWFHLLDLQRSGSPFEFHSYYIEKTKRFQKRSPRKELLTFSDEEEMSYGHISLPKKRKTTGGKKGQSKEPGKKSGMKQVRSL
jgi:hypothetical protein